MPTLQTDVLVVGAGSIGIACAYFLKLHNPRLDVLLIDSAQPMSFTSAQSGENYRNWWPHPVMKQFMDRSIELLDEFSAQTDNAINLTHRGYVLATRESHPDALLTNLASTFSENGALRHHSTPGTYQESPFESRAGIPDGVDVVSHYPTIRKHYPYLDEEVKTLIHIRRAGTLSAQQLGSRMLQVFRESGGLLRSGEVCNLKRGSNFIVECNGAAFQQIEANCVVNAAGPFVQSIAGLLDVELPVTNVLQQKIAFEDTHQAIDRRMPFTIDLDPQEINWSADEKAALAEDPHGREFLAMMPGSIHCRPEGETWIKLGWAYNQAPEEANRQPLLDDNFPEIVLRGASRLLPALKAYAERLPGNASHYGGYYTMTEENWPLIGETSVPGFFVVTGMSGFGSMAACAAGELLSCCVNQSRLPDYASALSLARYTNSELMQEIAALQSRGIL